MPEVPALDELKHATTTNPVVDIFRQRWSPRAFADKPVSDADLKSVFTAASWAASSYNEQPWRFVVGRKGDAVWEKIFGALVPMNQAWAKGAPVLYATFAKKTFSHNGSPNGSAVHDVGAASAHASLQATALGLHTHGMAGFDRAALAASIGLPDDFEPVVVWALGYLGDPEALPEPLKGMEFAPRSRKGLEQVVFGEWVTPGL